MLKQIDHVLCYLVIALGLLFLALTPMFAGSFVSPRGVEYIGAVLFLVFLGLLNLARIKSQHPSARLLAILGNATALAYLFLVALFVHLPAGIGLSLPVLALGCTSWMNRPRRAENHQQLPDSIVSRTEAQ
jgi:hypothetical protein